MQTHTADIDQQNEAIRKARLMGAMARLGTLRYSCFLDEQPSALVSDRARVELSLPEEHAELLVNSTFSYQSGRTLPPKILSLAAPTTAFLTGHPLAWVQDPGTRIRLPFWARGDWIDLLATLQPAAPAPAGLPLAVRRTLALARILVPSGYEQARRAQWEQILGTAAAQFRATGYTILHELLDPLHLGAMRAYYKAFLAGGTLIFGDEQVRTRYGLYGEALASFLHPQLTPLVSHLAGEPVKPSYAYFASYRPGSVLVPHTDREQCEYATSLLIDYVPEPDGPCGWPLFVENPGSPGIFAADLAMGDMLLYRGPEVVHWREALLEGHQSTSLFLFYVHESFTGRLW
jgi:hypothetical protein